MTTSRSIGNAKADKLAGSCRVARRLYRNGVLAVLFAVASLTTGILLFAQQSNTGTASMAVTVSPAVQLTTNGTTNVSLWIRLATGGTGSLWGDSTNTCTSPIAGATTFGTSGKYNNILLSSIPFTTSNNYVCAYDPGGSPASAFVAWPHTPSSLAFGQQPTSATAATSISPAVTVKVLDSNGLLDTGSTASVTLAIGTNPGGGTLSGTVTQAAVNGVAAFSNLSIDKAGTGYALTATSSSLTTATSSAFNITAGSVSASTSTVSASPASVVADGSTTSTITVTLKDANSNPVSGKTVSLTAGSGSSTINTLSGTTNSSGQATFTAKDTVAQPVVYTAKDVTDANLGITQTATVTFTPGTATKLAFIQQPTTTTVGSAISPAVTVQVQDANGNLVTTDSSTVTIGINGGGVLSGGSTLTAAAAGGVATFSNLVPTKSGLFTLSATDGSLTTVTSNSFTVNPAAASKLVFTTTAVTVTAGVASGTITVQRQDQFGNANTTEATRTVTLSSNSGGTVTFSPTSLSIATGSSSANFTYKDTAAGTPTITAASTSPTTITSATQQETVNPAAASKLVFTTTAVTVTAGVASGTITVQRQDQFGNANTTEATRTVTLSSNSGGTVTFSPTSLSIASGASSANFTYTDTKAGTPTITAASTSPTTITSATQQETVNPAAASKLAFTTTAVTVTAGVASGTITVQRQDQYGNANTTDATRTVTLASNSGGTVTFNPTSPVSIATGASSANFTYTDTKAGTPTITAASTSPTTITSATQQETVNPGTATQVRVETAADGSGTVVPAQSIASGSTLTVYAISRDASNNFVANVSATWSLVSITGGVVAGDLSPSSGTSATFTGHVIGTATIHAVSGSLTTTNSGTITVTAGTATQVKVETLANGSGTVVPAQSVASGSTLTVYAISRDASNNFVANVTATWSLTSITGGVVAGDLSPSSGTSAIFTGHVIGTAAIHAISGSLTTTNSGTITVTYGTASQLVFTTQTSGGVASVAFPVQPVLTIEDASGNTVTNYGTAVTLAMGTGSGTLTCTTNPATPASGVATFAGCKISANGNSDTLKATSGTLTSAPSSPFNITGAAAKLAFTTTPSGCDHSAGTCTAEPVVTVQDASGNTVTSSSDPITLTLIQKPSGGQFNLATNPLPATNGVATFTYTGGNKGGTNNWKLEATSGSLTLADSAVFSVQ